MKKWMILIIIALFSVKGFSQEKRDIPFSKVISYFDGLVEGKDIRVAVYDISYKDSKKTSGLSVYLAKGISRQITKSEKFQEISREDLENILKEHNLSQSDLFDQDKVAKIGKLKGIQGIIAGTYIVTDKEVIVDIRLVSIQTGEVKGYARSRISRKELSGMELYPEGMTPEHEKVKKFRLVQSVSVFMGNGSLGAVGYGLGIWKFDSMVSLGYTMYKADGKDRMGMPIALKVAFNIIDLKFMEPYVYGTVMYGVGLKNYKGRFGGGGGAGAKVIKFLFADAGYLLSKEGSGFVIGLGARFEF